MAEIDTSLRAAPSLSGSMDMIEELEKHLVARCTAALDALGRDYAAITTAGVYSLDDLENRQEGTIRGMTLGVAYAGSSPAQDRRANTNASNAVQALEFSFMVILLCPVSASARDLIQLDGARLDAGVVLTSLKRHLMGQRPAGVSGGGWSLSREVPVIGESSNTMLYYSQLWTLVMPVSSIT